MNKLDSAAETNEQLRLRNRIKQLTILHDIARAVTAVLDLQSVLNRIVEAAVFLTRAEEGFLMLVDAEAQTLQLRAGKGLGDKAAKVMNIPVNDSLSGHVLKTGKPLRMGGRQNDEHYKVKTGYLVKSILKVPIKTKNEVLGILSVDHAVEKFKTFSEQDVQILSLLAEYAAIAIANAQRYEAATRPLAPEPASPSREADREALQTFNQGLRAQRDAYSTAHSEINALAQMLYEKAGQVSELVEHLETWGEQASNLLPQLDWIAQTVLTRKQTGPLVEPDNRAEVQLIIDILLENLTTGILLCNAQGTILQVSNSAEWLLDHPKVDLLQTKLQNLFVDDAHWEHLVGSLRLGLALGDKQIPLPPQSNATFYREDRVLQVALFPLHKQSSREVSLVVMIEDISLETASWRVRDEAVNALSESLRTPLSAVHGYGDLLLNESVGLITSAQRRYLQRIRGGVDQMEDILMRFVSLLKDDLTALQSNKQVHLESAFNDAIDAAREELTLAGVQLENLTERALPPVKIAPEFFTRILIDLFLKAGAHIQPGESMSLTTDIQTGDLQPDYLVINIANNRINPRDKQEIKDDPDIKAIAKAMQYQGGRLWIEIDYQGKWTISLLLPIAI